MTYAEGPSTSAKPRRKHRIRFELPLHEGQREVGRHPARFKVVACGRQWGKTRLGCPLAIRAAAEGKWGWWVAPDFPLAMVGWRILKMLARQFGPLARIREAEKRIEFASGGWIEVKSAHTDASLRSATLDFIVMDEAAFTAERRWTAELRATVAVRKGWVLFLSTFHGKNWFWGLYERGREDGPDHLPDWKSWRHPSVSNPYVDAAEIEEARLELPEDVFRQEYEADPLVRAGAIFDRDWWKGKNRYRIGDPGRTVEGRWLSLDLSMKDKEQNAYNALTVFELTNPGYHLDVRYAWRERLSFPKLMPKLPEFARRWNYDGRLRGFLVEDKAHGITATQTIAEGADDWLRGIWVPVDPGGNSKEVRWNQAAAWCAHGCIRFPLPAAETSGWLTDYLEELYALPDAAYNDWADSFAQGAIWLEHLLADGLHARAAYGGLTA